MKAPVVLINPFSLPEDMKEEEFIQMWGKFAHILKEEPGFIDTKLHRSIDPNARFKFINVAHWESAEAWEAAMSNPKLQEVGKYVTFEQNPALYTIEVQY